MRHITFTNTCNIYYLNVQFRGINFRGYLDFANFRGILFLYIILFEFLLEKQFPPHLAVLKRGYLKLGIEFLHSVKSSDFLLKNSFI